MRRSRRNDAPAFRGRRLRSAVLALALLWTSSRAAAEPVNLKIAVVMPEGSAWTQTLHRMAAEVRNRSGGQLAFTVFAGGVSGDEPDVLRKLQIDRLQAAGLSGVGLGLLLPKLRILEMPLLCRDEAEFDHLKAALTPELADDLAARGFRLLGFTEAGPVYFFGKRPLVGSAALQQTKMWAWKGDPLAERFLRAFGIAAVPLNVVDVTTGLETGMIDAFYAPPLAAMAFQWHARVGHRLDYPLARSIGALVVRRATFDALSPESARLLEETGGRYCQELVQTARRENTAALDALQRSGLTAAPPSAEQAAAFGAQAEAVRRGCVPDFFPEAFLQRVEALLAAYRASRS